MQKTERYLGLILFTSLAITMVLMTRRGLWLDEAYSIWFAGHDVSLKQAVLTRWTRDGHPIVYPLYTWFLEPVFGRSVSTFRFVNLGVLMFAGATWRLVRKSTDDTKFYLIYGLMVCSTPFFVLYAAEFRSYFAQLVLSACLLAQLRLLRYNGAHFGLKLLTGATAILLINIHYVGSISAFIILGVSIREFYKEKASDKVLFLVCITLIGMLGLSISVILFLTSTTPTKTNVTSLADAILYVCIPLGAGLIANPLALFGAVKSVYSRGFDSYSKALLVMSVGIAIVYVIYDSIEYNLVIRFLISAVPISSALVAHNLTRSESDFRRLWLPISILSLTVVGITTTYGLINKRWESSAQTIVSAVRSCPTSKVVALSSLSFVDPSGPIARSVGTREAFSVAYALVAAKYKFPVTIAYRGRPSTSLTFTCPTLLWVEHAYLAPDNVGQLLAMSGLHSPTGHAAIRRLRWSPERRLLAIMPINR